MKQTDPQFKIRLTAELKERLEEAAGDTRTISAEIIDRLQKSFEPHPAETQVMDLRNAMLAQGGLIAIQAAFITTLAKDAPPGSPEANVAATIAKHFGTKLAEKSTAGLPQKSAAEQRQTLKRLGELGAELRASDLDNDVFAEAMGRFVNDNPDLFPKKAQADAKAQTAPKKVAKKAAIKATSKPRT